MYHRVDRKYTAQTKSELPSLQCWLVSLSFFLLSIHTLIESVYRRKEKGERETSQQWKEGISLLVLAVHFRSTPWYGIFRLECVDTAEHYFWLLLLRLLILSQQFRQKSSFTIYGALFEPQKNLPYFVHFLANAGQNSLHRRPKSLSQKFCLYSV